MAIEIATYGPKIGPCNICGDVATLTEDHTPPKGWQRPTQVEIRHISSHLGSGPPTKQVRRSQNGIKYRTLCGRCNSGLLGSRYDPKLISLATELSLYLRTGMHFGSQITLLAQPQAIMRSVLGHIAAQGVGRYQKGPKTGAFRDYLLNESLPLPDGIFIYYWVYPHRPTLVVRDAAYVNVAFGQNAFAMWLLKAFPLAFLVAWGDPSCMELAPQSFEPWRTAPFDLEVALPIKLRPLLPAYWPEAPSDNTIIAYGKEAIHGLA